MSMPVAPPGSRSHSVSCDCASIAAMREQPTGGESGQTRSKFVSSRAQHARGASDDQTSANLRRWKIRSHSFPTKFESGPIGIRRFGVPSDSAKQVCSPRRKRVMLTQRVGIHRVERRKTGLGPIPHGYCYGPVRRTTGDGDTTSKTASTNENRKPILMTTCDAFIAAFVTFRTTGCEPDQRVLTHRAVPGGRLLGHAGRESRRLEHRR
jgi:hypothetical protein